ncbi:Gp15 family bacteriophage protein [Oceanobacillus sp. CF4.6]|uniref:Gp15 family bacteriophage protein n=1 Tax=Oceanobacillus sp. CF4.6 TaxID=3373080 RepID=UPI003EE5C422
MFLTEELEDKFKYSRYVLHVDMTFDNILELFELFENDSFPEHEKVLTGLEMLLFDYSKIEDLNFEEQYDLFKYIMKEFIDIDLDKKQEQAVKQAEGQPTKPPDEKAYDFKVDAERIYASFFMDYGMDLIEQQGKLHWKKFLALLNGLSEGTSFMKVVHYRTMEVPKATKGNEKHRAEIKQMKDKYSLLTDEEKVSRMDSQFDGIGNAFVKAGEKLNG